MTFGQRGMRGGEHLALWQASRCVFRVDTSSQARAGFRDVITMPLAAPLRLVCAVHDIRMSDVSDGLSALRILEDLRLFKFGVRVLLRMPVGTKLK